jgi:hypothetical protein
VGLAHPQLFGAHRLAADGGEPAHASGLRGVAVERVGADVVQAGAQGCGRVPCGVVEMGVETFAGGRQRLAHEWGR